MTGKVVAEITVRCSANVVSVSFEAGFGLQREVISALLLMKSVQLEVFLALTQQQGQQMPDHCILILNRKNFIMGAAFNAFLQKHLPILHSFHKESKLTIIWWPHAVPVQKHQELVQKHQEVVQKHKFVFGILVCVIFLLLLLRLCELLNRTSQPSGEKNVGSVMCRPLSAGSERKIHEGGVSAEPVPGHHSFAGC